MNKEELQKRLRELAWLYSLHASNQSSSSLEIKNKLHRELHDKFLLLKPYIKRKTRLQWYEPVYNYAIAGNRDYIESVREDLAYITTQYEAEQDASSREGLPSDQET